MVAALLANGCKDKQPTKVDPKPPEPDRPQPVKPKLLEALDHARRADIAKLKFVPRPELCLAATPVAPADVEVDTTLFVHDDATLTAGNFSLRRTLKKIADDGVAGGAVGETPEILFRDLWDTQNPEPATSPNPNIAYCTKNGTTLNGFPNVCRPAPAEGGQVVDPGPKLDAYKPLALVNRFDLAAEGWKNCGEHRIIYGFQGPGIVKTTIIFEAVLPNPRPGCESGCRGIEEAWLSMKGKTPADRAKLLEQMFYTGYANYRPIVHLDHYSATGVSSGYGMSGGGQIRTDQFLANAPSKFPWVLKEFKLALDCTKTPCVLDAVPTAIDNNPAGTLWTPATTGAANDFQRGVVLASVASLANPDPAAFGYAVPHDFDAAFSDSQDDENHDDYLGEYKKPGTGTFAADLKAAAGGLTDDQIVRRANVNSCGGCHMPQRFGLTAPGAIGGPVDWVENQIGFIHVGITAPGGVHELSKTLVQTFLPARQKFVADYLSKKPCLCSLPHKPLPTKPPLTLKDLREREEELEPGVVEELKKLAPSALNLKLGPNEDQATARRAEVARQLRAIPPRKTVTGSFRTE